MRECGLKLVIHANLCEFSSVTPYAGVWIEIGTIFDLCFVICVTPYAGVWIEIKKPGLINVISSSLPMRECGLKYRLSLHITKIS